MRRAAVPSKWHPCRRICAASAEADDLSVVERHVDGIATAPRRPGRGGGLEEVVATDGVVVPVSVHDRAYVPAYGSSV